MSNIYQEADAKTPFGAIRNHGLLKLQENVLGRDFVVGDVHGQSRDLWAALARVDFDVTRDRLISVGDLIDRGPESRHCLELIYEPWFHAVLGNHEDFFLSAFIEEDQRAVLGLIQNGGGWILGEDEGDMKALAADLANLPLAIELPFKGKTLGVIHAAVTSGVWGDFDMDADIWNRRISEKKVRQPMDVPEEANVRGVDAVVVGHNVLKTARMLGNTLQLDTGAARGWPLSLWSLEDVAAALAIHGQAKALISEFPVCPGNVNVNPYPDDEDAVGLSMNP